MWMPDPIGRLLLRTAGIRYNEVDGEIRGTYPPKRRGLLEKISKKIETDAWRRGIEVRVSWMPNGTLIIHRPGHPRMTLKVRP